MKYLLHATGGFEDTNGTFLLSPARMNAIPPSFSNPKLYLEPIGLLREDSVSWYSTRTFSGFGLAIREKDMGLEVFLRMKVASAASSLCPLRRNVTSPSHEVPGPHLDITLMINTRGIIPAGTTSGNHPMIFLH